MDDTSKAAVLYAASKKSGASTDSANAGVWIAILLGGALAAWLLKRS